MAKCMRIFQVATHSRLESGGAIQMFLLAKGLKERGHEVTCIFHRRAEAKDSSEGLLKKGRQEGISIETFNQKRYRDLLQFRSLIKKSRPEVIHTHRGGALDFVLKATLGLKVPCLFVQRGNSNPLSLLNAIKYKSQKIDKVIAVSEGVKDVLLASGGLNPDKVEVVYGGFDSDLLSPQVTGEKFKKELFNSSPEVPLVGMIANYDGKKGFEEFLEAASLVVREEPEVLFLVVGRAPKERFEPLMQRLGLEGRVIFTCFRHDIAEVIASLRVSVSSSTRSEGLTGALRESLAMAKPVVGTDVGGNRELIIHGETGLLVLPKNPQALAEAVLFLLRNPQKAAEMGQRGRSLVQEKFSNQKRCQRMEELYLEVLEKKGLLEVKVR